jgi:DNA-binding GntR family transcriptional regulator
MIVEALDRGDGNAASAAMAHHLHWVHQANYRD